MAEDATLTVSVATGLLANDSDADGHGLSAVLADGPIHGTLALHTDGSLTYTPAPDYAGMDSFSYHVQDGYGGLDEAEVTLVITPVNDAPLARDDAYSVMEDTTLILAIPDILANDSDVDGDALSVVRVADPQHGSLTLNPDGSFSYTPMADYAGADTFSYRLTDGQAESDPATVTLTVIPVNDAPLVDDDVYLLAEDSGLTIEGPGVLGNDRDPDGDRLSAVLLNAPQHGDLSFNSDGSFSYTPVADYTGSDQFSYQAWDGQVTSDSATVTLFITALDDAPLADDDAYTLAEDSVLTLGGSGVLGNDRDVDGQVLSALLVEGPQHGRLSLYRNGSFSYTPATDYTGSDRFTYRVRAGRTESPLATVNLTVTPVNDAPHAVNDAYSLVEGSQLTIAAAGVLANDSDVDGDALSAMLVTGPQHGVLTLNSNGGLSYAPTADFYGEDSFTYRTSDGQFESNLATVTLTVTPLESLRVVSFTPTETGFAVRFNRAVEASRLNLYDAESVHLGAADVTLERVRRKGNLPLTGSLVLDADQQGFTFIQTGCLLGSGIYQVVLSSRSDGFTDLNGRLLDGDGDGVSGANYVTTFTIMPFTGAVLSVDDIVRGPGQPLNTNPQFNNGLGIGLNWAAGATDVRFTLNYDPSLLTISGVNLPRQLPAGSQLLEADYTSQPGRLTVHLQLGAQLDAAWHRLLWIKAQVPVTAPYGAKHILDLSDIRLNGGTLPVRGNDGLHVVAYLGDASGDGGYSTLDVQPIQRVVKGLDRGFGAYPLVDPLLLGNINEPNATDNQQLAEADAVRLEAELNGTDQKSIPPLPLHTVTPLTPLRVVSFTPTDTGFAVRFNRAFDASRLNLYDADSAHLGAADVTLERVRQKGNLPLIGSLVLDADQQGFTFIQTGGLLGSGMYQVVLSSRSDGFTDLNGQLLDGDGNGVSGADYVTTFTVTPFTGAVLSVSDIVRGPGQPLNINPQFNNGFWIGLNRADGATDVRFTLNYDPSLLTISGVNLPQQLPAGSQLLEADYTSQLGQLTVHLQLGAPLLDAAWHTLLWIKAQVPVTAPYGAKYILDLSEIQLSDLNGGTLPVRGNDGLHVVAYLGDASGDGGYSTLDVQRIQRVVNGLDRGFGAYPLVDPLLLGNIKEPNATDNQQLTEADAARLEAELNGIDQKSIPALPPHSEPLTFAGADPYVHLPAVTAQPGQTVRVPVLLDTAAGLELVQLTLAYPEKMVELTGVRRGSLTTDYQWYLEHRQPGGITVDMSRLKPLDGGQGSLLELDFKVSAQASGPIPLDLQAARLNDSRLTLNSAPRIGSDATDGMIQAPMKGMLAATHLPTEPAPEAACVYRPSPTAPRIDLTARYQDSKLNPGRRQNEWLSDWLEGVADKPRQAAALRIELDKPAPTW